MVERLRIIKQTPYGLDRNSVLFKDFQWLIQTIEQQQEQLKKADHHNAMLHMRLQEKDEFINELKEEVRDQTKWADTYLKDSLEKDKEIERLKEGNDLVEGKLLEEIDQMYEEIEGLKQELLSVAEVQLFSAYLFMDLQKESENMSNEWYNFLKKTYHKMMKLQSQ